MDIFDGIYQYIQGFAAITSVLGSPPEIYPELGPQSGQLPYVIFTSNQTDREMHLKGASAIGDFYISFEIYADTYANRQSIGEAFRNILHTRQNVVLTDLNSNKVTMEWAELKRDDTSMKSPPDGTETFIFCRNMVFRCVIDEPKPTLP